MNVGTIWASLKLNMQGFSKGLKEASASATAFATSVNGKFNGIGAVIDDMAKAGQKSKFEFKDVARIVQGIIISKIFYSGLQSIRRCNDAVWEFSQSLEYAKIAYTNLFGDNSLAEEFINVLKDFAAKTPFNFTESEQAAKRLLAYGVQYKNVMYIMRGVMSAASMQGDPAKIESISRALGQIYTKGRVMNEEMRQLAEAGIPVYEILREKLGLTQKQLQNLGKESVSASAAINALVDGMTERFGNVVEASSRTMSGILNNIKDNATMLASGLFEPAYTKLKSFFDYIGKSLFNLRDIFETQGAGGVFEALVPKELQPTIRQLMGNFMMLGNTIKNLVVTAFDILRPIAMSFVIVFNALAPIILNVINVLAALVSILVRNEAVLKTITFTLSAAAAMWVVFKLRALASAVIIGVINGISVALKVLSVMMTFVSTHPLWALLIGLSGILVGISGGFSSVGKAINSAFKSLTNISGIDTDKLLLPSQKERANDLDKFNKKLDGTADSMDNLSDKTGKAAKAAKQLLSFDEVFKLKEPDEKTSANKKDDADNISIPDINIPSGDAYIPDVPDFTGFINDYITKLKGAFGDIGNKLKSAGIGALLGAALGMILTGNPVAAAIAAAAGAIVGWFWDDLASKIGLTDAGKVAIPIATALGAIIGGLIGGPAGAAIGAAVGLLAGWLIDGIARGLETGDWSAIAMPLSIGIGAGIGFLVGGPVGAAIGTAIGTLTGWLITAISDGITKSDWSGVAMPLGTSLGAAIGLVAAGPVGAAIGALVGWIVGAISEAVMTNWDAVKEAFVAPFSYFGEVTSAIWDAVAGFFEDAFNADNFLDFGKNILLGIVSGIGAALYTVLLAIGSLFQAIVEALKAAFGIASPAKKMKPYGSFILQGILGGFVDAVVGFVSAIGDFFVSIGNALASGAATLVTNISTWFTNRITDIGNFLSSIGTAVSTAFTNIKDAVAEKVSAAFSAVSTTFTNIKDTISDKAGAAFSAVSTTFTNVKNTIGEKISSAYDNTKTVFGNIKDTIGEKAGSAYRTVKDSFSNIFTSVKTSLGNVKSTASSVLSSVLTSFTDWVSNLWNKVFDKLFGWIGDLVDGFKSLFSASNDADINVGSSDTPSTNSVKTGHATGGIFDREHVARFAEGNKAEAVIPLENAGAMQPFVDAVANGITASLMPIVANVTGNQEQLQPLYVGTLIADDRSLKELNRKMQVIQLQENARRGY